MTFASFAYKPEIEILPAAGADLARTLKRVDRIAKLLDSAVHIPFTRIRIGADALLDVIPGVGAIAGQALSFYIVAEAVRHGAPANLIAKMLGRIGIDLALGVTPVAGWVADVFYRANLANAADLKLFLQQKSSRDRI